MAVLIIQELPPFHPVLLQRNGTTALLAMEQEDANIVVVQVNINTLGMGNAILVTEQEMGNVPGAKEKGDGISNR